MSPKSIREAMTRLGTYKPEYDHTIKVYADLATTYNRMLKRFAESDYQYDEATAQGRKKAPIVAVLESMRKDLLAYENALGLTPAGLKKIQDPSDAKKKKPGGIRLLPGVTGNAKSG